MGAIGGMDGNFASPFAPRSFDRIESELGGRPQFFP
jgi:hypothetical protein